MTQFPEQPGQFNLDDEARATSWSVVPGVVRVSYTVNEPVRLLAAVGERTDAETAELLTAAQDAIEAWNRQQ